MKLTCPNCQTSYQIADEKIPPRGARANCPNCGQMMLIPGAMEKSEAPSFAPGEPEVDFGQTIAYNFSEVDQSRTEISAFLEKISEQKPFIEKGLILSLKDIRTGKEYPVSGAEVTVGRSGTEITVDDPEVSRRHCMIKVFGDRVVIMDLESTNGTYIDGKRVMTGNLGIGERFTIGNTTLELAGTPSV
jgi:predicted Zn finger-like uncharacterized protein